MLYRTEAPPGTGAPTDKKKFSQLCLLSFAKEAEASGAYTGSFPASAEMKVLDRDPTPES